MSLRVLSRVQAHVYNHSGYVVTLVRWPGTTVDVYVREDIRSSTAPAYHIRVGTRPRFGASKIIEHAIQSYCRWSLENEIASFDETEEPEEPMPSTVHSRLMAPDEF